MKPIGATKDGKGAESQAAKKIAKVSAAVAAEKTAEKASAANS